MRGLRTIPVLIDIAKDMEALCPEALLINYANPMCMNQWALSRASDIRTVGLCHSVPGTAHELARDIGVPLEDVNYLVAGINHMAFYLKYERRDSGEDLYPLIHQVYDEGRVPAQQSRALRDVQTPGLFRHRIQRAFQRIRALVHQGERAPT